MTEQFEKMLLDVEIMVDWQIKRSGMKIKNRDDLIQDVRVRLLRWPPDLSKYEPTTCIMKAMWHSLYGYQRKKLPTEKFTELVDKHVDNIDCVIDAHEMLKCVTAREKKIIKLYFGIGCKPQNENELSRKMGVSNTLIGNLKRRGLQQIREKYVMC